MSGPPTSRSAWMVCVFVILLWIGLSEVTFDVQDFYNFHAGARLVLAGRAADLHQDIPVTHRITFYRAPFYALIVAPLGFFSPEVARHLWMVFQGLVLCGSLLWAGARFGHDAFLFGLVFVPATLGMVTGQDSALMLGLATVSYFLTERGRPAAAGALLGAGFAIKPHLFLLWPVLLLLSRKFRMLAGFMVSIAAALGLSLALSGIQGLRDYAYFLQRSDLIHLNPHLEMQANVRGALLSLGLASPWPNLAISAAVVLAACRRSRKASWWLVFALSFSGSMLISPHVYAYDLTTMVLPSWCLIFFSRVAWMRIAGFAVAVCPITGALGSPFSALMGLALLFFFSACLLAERESKSPRPDEAGIVNSAPASG